MWKDIPPPPFSQNLKNACSAALQSQAVENGKQISSKERMRQETRTAQSLGSGLNEMQKRPHIFNEFKKSPNITFLPLSQKSQITEVE